MLDSEMTEVTQDQFFQFLRDNPLDIMPSLVARDHSDWMTPSRVIYGRTYPGWANPGDQKVYLISTAALRLRATLVRERDQGAQESSRK